MTLQELSLFHQKRSNGIIRLPTGYRSNLSVEAIELFEIICVRRVSKASAILTASTLRDFLARCYLELAIVWTDEKNIHHLKLCLDRSKVLEWNKGAANDCRRVPGAASELEESLPRAIEISSALSKHLNTWRPFGFPEFLTFI